MDAITALTTRASVPRLTEPGPDAAQLDTLLRCAVRAPDHGLLRPWRFLVFSGQERRRLAEILVDATLEDQPELDQAAREKLAAKVYRAPMVMVVVAETQPEHRIPVLEQILAVGAAVQNIMVAAHALGIGAMWRTGALASHPLVKQRLGFAEKDEIVAMLYLGTPARDPNNTGCDPEPFVLPVSQL